MRIVLWPAESGWGSTDRYTPAMPPSWVERLREAAGTAHLLTPSSEVEAASDATGADGWIGRLTPDLLAAAPHLRWLQAPTISLETIMFSELAASNVVVTNMRNVGGSHIANHALALFLALCRDLPRLARCQMKREWARTVEVRDPAEMTVVIIGLGAIGALLARRLGVLGSRVIGVDPKVTAAADVDEVVAPDQLDAVLPVADAVIVCAPETPQTRGLFNEATFGKMKQGALFINVGRGKIVQLEALEQALRGGRIGGAGMDVFESEPLPPESALWGTDRVIITPHSAGRGPGQEEGRIAIIIENLRRFIEGRPLMNTVDKVNWY